MPARARRRRRITRRPGDAQPRARGHGHGREPARAGVDADGLDAHALAHLGGGGHGPTHARTGRRARPARGLGRAADHAARLRRRLHQLRLHRAAAHRRHRVRPRHGSLRCCCCSAPACSSATTSAAAGRPAAHAVGVRHPRRPGDDPVRHDRRIENTATGGDHDVRLRARRVRRRRPAAAAGDERRRARPRRRVGGEHLRLHPRQRARDLPRRSSHRRRTRDWPRSTGWAA